MTDAARLLVWAAIGLVLVAVAFALRVRIHLGQAPSGVDTWYYLAYADAVRRRPGLDVRLPRYLLQDERQSYAPLFPSVLALVPRDILRRWFWAVSPAIDCAHLLLLYWLAFKITNSVAAAVLSACIYVFTPHLISETRSLNGRSFSALLHSVAIVLALRYVLSDGSLPALAMALLSGSLVFLASATAAAAYGFVCVVLSIVFQEPRYVLLACGSLATAVLLSLGHYLRVIRNYVQAAQYWRRNRGRFGAHPIHHSPIYGRPDAAPRRANQRPGFLGTSTLPQVLRLIGENPFLLALPLAPLNAAPWGPRLYWWAISLAGLSVVATVFPPLQAFGPGRSYMKAAVFPTAYTLAVGIGSINGVLTPLGLATLTCLLLSMAAIAYFYRYMASRTTEQTASAPPGLVRAVQHLARLPLDGVFCLPTMYADYTCYNAGKKILWGGHCGDLSRFELVAPVITRPVPELLREYNIYYVLLDQQYAQPADVGLADLVEPLGAWDTFALYQVLPAPRPHADRTVRAGAARG